jgi:hypothetical protein
VGERTEIIRGNAAVAFSNMLGVAKYDVRATDNARNDDVVVTSDQGTNRSFEACRRVAKSCSVTG